MRTAPIFGVVLFLSLLPGRSARADVPPNCDDPADPGSAIQDDPLGDGGEDASVRPDAGPVPSPRGGSCPPSSGSNGSSCSMSRVGIDASIGGLMMMIGAVSLLASRRRRS